MNKIAHLLFLSSSISFAAGMISIKGDLLQKCSDKNCQIKVGTQLYILDILRLNDTLRKKIKNKTAGDTIIENVSMTSISDVKDIK